MGYFEFIYYQTLIYSLCLIRLNISFMIWKQQIGMAHIPYNTIHIYWEPCQSHSSSEEHYYTGFVFFYIGMIVKWLELFDLSYIPSP